MIIREDLEKREHEILSPFACKSSETKGRSMMEEKCKIRTEFQRDRDRILHSKAFRRLMHKTQVFLAPKGDHFRTRLTHTLEVAQISKTVARGLGLNEDLTEAISLGHDLGHTPFGHSGEEVLNKIHRGGFRHNVQSLRVVEVLEGNKGRFGMNLTEEVKDGILNHTGSVKPFTLEGQIVKICDRVAYINHDIDDALRSGVINFEQLPKSCINLLGKSHRSRINNLILSLIKHSYNENEIKMAEDMQSELLNLRKFMFENVYRNPEVKKIEELKNVKVSIEKLYSYYVENPDELPKYDEFYVNTYDCYERAKDYIAGMTDRFAIESYKKIEKK